MGKYTRDLFNKKKNPALLDSSVKKNGIQMYQSRPLPIRTCLPFIIHQYCLVIWGEEAGGCTDAL